VQAAISTQPSRFARVPQRIGCDSRASRQPMRELRIRPRQLPLFVCGPLSSSLLNCCCSLYCRCSHHTLHTLLSQQAALPPSRHDHHHAPRASQKVGVKAASPVQPDDAQPNTHAQMQHKGFSRDTGSQVNWTMCCNITAPACTALAAAPVCLCFEQGAGTFRFVCSDALATYCAGTCTP